MSSSNTPSRARRLELILQRIDALPTLPSVAMRLMRVIDDDDADAKQIVELLSADQAMTGKILALCRSAHSGVREEVTTLDKAVVLLGFEAIRNAVLSVKVFEVFSDAGRHGFSPAFPAKEDDGPRFDREAFWRHALAVGVAAEMISRRHPRLEHVIPPSEAFVCGLMHDVGKLALDHVLPRAYQRVVELTEQHRADIAELERRVIGLDHHTTGKRLAEHWRLPHVLIDTIWLHAAPCSTLPDLPHRMMIALVGLADRMVRRQRIGYSGNFILDDDADQRIEQIGLDREQVDQVAEQLPEELNQRAAALGLGEAPSRERYLESVVHANSVLGELNERLESRVRNVEGQSQVLDAIVRFHESCSMAGRGPQDALAATVQCAASVFGEGFYATLAQAHRGEPWTLCHHNREGRVTRSELIDPPSDAPELRKVGEAYELSGGLLGLLPWVAPWIEGIDPARVRVLGLPCGWGTAGIVLHDRPRLPPTEQLQTLRHTWGAAVAAAAQHEGARRLGEQLVEANRRLAQTQQQLLNHLSMARLGEMAAGAAHEMNNPLAIISGRAQLLSGSLPRDSKDGKSADLIVRQSRKLSDLITALRLFADPPRPTYEQVEPRRLLDQAMDVLRARVDQPPDTDLELPGPAPAFTTDASHAATALGELLVNAAEANPAQPIQVRVYVDALSNRLIFQVTDAGGGMSAHVMEHAFDPFFSAKPAGRQSGLGLARARRLLEGVGGEIELSSREGEGTVAKMGLPLKASARIAETNQEEREERHDAHAAFVEN